MCSSDDDTNVMIEDFSTSPAVKVTLKDADKNNLGYRIAHLDGMPTSELRKITINQNLSTDDPDDRNITIDLYTNISKTYMLLQIPKILKNFPKDIKLGK